MKDIIDEDVEKDWSQNGSLRHTFEDWLKITLKDKDYCPIEIIKGLTDKVQFQ